MRGVHSDPISLVLARWLSLLVTGLPLVGGAWLLASGVVSARDARDPGPANWPDLDGVFTAFGGCVLLTLAAPVLGATIGVWRRKRAATILLAALCAAALFFGVWLRIVSSRPVPSARSCDWSSAVSVAYGLLLAACAVASARAAIELRRLPGELTEPQYAPPPLPGPVPDFDVVDDLPKDDEA